MMAINERLRILRQTLSECLLTNNGPQSAFFPLRAASSKLDTATAPEVTHTCQSRGPIRPDGRPTRCAIACLGDATCGGFAIDKGRNVCLFYWKHQVENDPAVVFDGECDLYYR